MYNIEYIFESKFKILIIFFFYIEKKTIIIIKRNKENIMIFSIYTQKKY